VLFGLPGPNEKIKVAIVIGDPEPLGEIIGPYGGLLPLCTLVGAFAAFFPVANQESRRSGQLGPARQRRWTDSWASKVNAFPTAPGPLGEIRSSGGLLIE